MKKNKSILFVTVLLLVAANVVAQEKKATFGIKAGVNISNIGSTDEKEFDNTKSNAGFHAGVTLDYAFTPQWYLLTGLEYSVKGVTIEMGSGYYDWDVSAAYLQIPVSAGYKFRINDDFAVLVNMGSYFAYGIHGKAKAGSREDDTFSDDWLKNFDCGLLFGGSLEWKQLCFRLGGEIGLVNVMQPSNSKAENRNFTLSVGYKF